MWPASREQLVQQQPQLVDVRGRGDRLPRHLLGARVLWRHRPDAGARPRRAEPLRRVVDQLGDPEVEQLDLALVGDQDVARLQVPVHHQVAVRVLHRPAHAGEEAQALGQSDTPRAAVLRDRRSFDQLHDQVRAPVLGGASVHQPRDVRVVQVREDLPLGAEALQHVVRVQPPAQQLDGDPLREVACVAFRAVHRSPPAAPDLLHHPVTPDARGHRRYRLRSLHLLPRHLPQHGPDEGLRGALQEAAASLLRVQQGVHRRQQLRVAAAGPL
jgi:hypothetical protein